MAFLTIQNFSSLISQADVSQNQRAVSGQRLVTPAATAQEVQQIRQISSEASATKAKVDKEREPSTPKKTDAGFASQEDKEDQQFQKPSVSGKKQNGQNKKLQIVA